MYAGSATRFEQGFREIAAKISIPGHNDPKINILPRVHEWLDNERNGPWLLILDNADDSGFLLKPWEAASSDASANSQRALHGYIPRKSHGAMLVTSRNRTAAYDLIGNYDQLIKLDPMNMDDSLTLLESKINISPMMKDDAIRLLKALERIPLAITQAGAYIRQNESVMTVSKYLEKFLENEQNTSTLLNKPSTDLRRDHTVPNAVISTWEISFNQIRQSNRPAAELLSLMSLFNRQNIPDFLVQGNEDDLAFIDTIGVLENFSLINTESGGKFFNMHRLVQVATRKWLEVNELLQKWKANAIERMAERFPNGAYENWERCKDRKSVV